MVVSSLGEVKRWVMSFGSHAEVISPEKLRREVADESLALARTYAK